MEPVRVYLEVGAKSVFAVAVDWPGWCRRARTADQALAVLEEYRPRYAKVVGSTPRGAFEVLGEVPGNATTDFGAPTGWGPWDEDPVDVGEMRRLVSVLGACWTHFDSVVAESPETLRKGPRGGGRDRDAVAAHVREAERAYAPKIGARIAPRTPWPVQRGVLAAALEAPGATAWPARYGLRRLAWHVTDHAWEVEDRREQ